MQNEKEIANQALKSADHVSNLATLELKNMSTLSSDVYANRPTDIQILANNKRLRDKEQQLLMARSHPFYASVTVKNCNTGRIETYYITRGGELPSLNFTIENVENGILNDHVPKASLVSQDIGDFYEVELDRRTEEYEILQKNSFDTRRVAGEWDASAKMYFKETASSHSSLRTLLQSVDSDVFSFSEEFNESTTGKIKQDVISSMGLRDNPILDKFQDKIQRQDPDIKIIVLGPPGTGKTTTLIKKLGLNLDSNDENSRLPGDKSWYMFTPTELLKVYLKEAFSRENIAAPDENVFVWKDFIRNIARDNLMLLETSLRSGFQLSDENYIKVQSSENQKNIFINFFEFQNKEFLSKLATAHKDIMNLKDPEIKDMLGYLSITQDTRIVSICNDLEKIFEKVSEKLQKIQAQLKNIVGKALTDGLKWEKETIKESLFNLRNEIDSKYKIVSNTEDIGDDDDEEEKKYFALSPQEIIQKYLIEPVQNLAYTFYKKKKISEKSFNFIVGNTIKFDKIIPDNKKNEIGALVEELKLLRNFRNPKSRYLSSLKTNYRSFRRLNKDYYIDTFNPRAISYPELDIVILAYFKAYKAFKMDKLDEALMRRQIFVDEITDFSAVQIAIMDNLLQKNSKCFFGAGDINQRLTEIGVSSVDDFKWALEQVQIEEIKIPYRQSKQLFELSTKIIGARVDSYEQPKYIDNDRLDPVAGYSLDSMEKQADWLATRIIEIERKIETLPSIAILVNTEDKVKKLADELNKRLKHNNIAVDACENGRIIGNRHSVRVFCIDYIKGLEFEAAFFMDVDELADLKPRIFEKYLYVGISRAATFLGLTSRRTKMPDKIENLRSMFVSNWE